jgi:hypothetical protein
MSGAVVFGKDAIGDPVAVGIVIEHRLSEGSSTLTLSPLTRLADIAGAFDPCRLQTPGAAVSARRLHRSGTAHHGGR